MHQRLLHPSDRNAAQKRLADILSHIKKYDFSMMLDSVMSIKEYCNSLSFSNYTDELHM